MVLAGGDSRSQEHAEHRRVDRVPQKPIRSSADQFVVQADSDFCTPIATQMPPRPDCQEKKCCLDDRADGHEKMKPLRQEPPGQTRCRPETQEERCIERDLMESG